jgi:hypothetical protein
MQTYKQSVHLNALHLKTAFILQSSPHMPLRQLYYYTTSEPDVKDRPKVKQFNLAGF